MFSNYQDAKNYEYLVFNLTSKLKEWNRISNKLKSMVDSNHFEFHVFVVFVGFVKIRFTFRITVNSVLIIRIKWFVRHHSIYLLTGLKQKTAPYSCDNDIISMKVVDKTIKESYTVIVNGSVNLDVSILISIHRPVLHTTILSRWMIKIRVKFRKKGVWLRQKQQRLVSFGNCSMQRLRNHLLFSTDMKFCDISWLELNVTWKSFVWINVMIKSSTWHYCDKVDYLACYCKQGVFRSASYTNTQTYNLAQFEWSANNTSE